MLMPSCATILYAKTPKKKTMTRSQRTKEDRSAAGLKSDDDCA